MNALTLTTEQRDRLTGVLLGTAVGDALGAPLEFGPVVPYPAQIGMTGGGSFGWAPGGWTDDTSMAMIIVEALACHGNLDAGPALDQIAEGFHDWARVAPDVGAQTRQVLGAARFHGVDAAHLTAAAAEYTARQPEQAGNGSLMRTAPVALAALHDPVLRASRARAVSALTHANVDATDACVLWCSAIAHAVLEGRLTAAREGLFAGLDQVDASRRELWAQRIEAAEAAEPWDFPKNGWVVHAFQAAWSAIACTRDHDGAPTEAFVRGVDHAVRCGWDTDTVGAIAGALLGAVHGASAIPSEWVGIINGWPGYLGDDLVTDANRIMREVGLAQDDVPSKEAETR